MLGSFWKKDHFISNRYINFFIDAQNRCVATVWHPGGTVRDWCIPLPKFNTKPIWERFSDIAIFLLRFEANQYVSSYELRCYEPRMKTLSCQHIPGSFTTNPIPSFKCSNDEHRFDCVKFTDRQQKQEWNSIERKGYERKRKNQ